MGMAVPPGPTDSGGAHVGDGVALVRCARCHRPVRKAFTCDGATYGCRCVRVVDRALVRLEHAAFVGPLAWIALKAFTIREANGLIAELALMGIEGVVVK